MLLIYLITVRCPYRPNFTSTVAPRLVMLCCVQIRMVLLNFRWDKDDLSMYYCLTGELLYGIDVPYDLLASDCVVDESAILPILDGL